MATCAFSHEAFFLTRSGKNLGTSGRVNRKPRWNEYGRSRNRCVHGASRRGMENSELLVPRPIVGSGDGGGDVFGWQIDVRRCRIV